MKRSQAEVAALPVLDGLQAELSDLRDSVNRERAAYGEARARHDGLEREAQARADRLKAIEPETETVARARRHAPTSRSNS